MPNIRPAVSRCGDERVWTVSRLRLGRADAEGIGTSGGFFQDHRQKARGRRGIRGNSAKKNKTEQQEYFVVCKAL